MPLTNFQQSCLLVATMTLASTAAAAGPCEKNFRASGIPLVSAMSYRSFQDFAGLSPDKALARLARAVKTEGFAGIKVSKKRGTIDAWQETSGSGRAQTLRVSVEKLDGGVRAAAVFKIQAGQLTEDRVVRKGICKIIAAADG